MSSKTPLIDSPTIIERLQEIQRTEARAGVAGAENHRRIEIEVVPFYEAPVREVGLVRLRTDGKPAVRSGTRCSRCPLSATNNQGCMCYSGMRPIQFLKLPPGWLD